ncbi:MAG: PAS domain-containing sensor histidine kinase [Planctomycetota bacterium]|jgi:PAS domain S-box-containing protein
MSENGTHILVVENEEAHAELIRRAFSSRTEHIRLTIAGDLREARSYLRKFVPDLVIADLLLPDGKGTELLPGGSEEAAYPVVVMTGHGDEQIAVDAMKAGALDYIVKSETTLSEMPHLAEGILREWHHIVEQKKTEEKLRKSEERFRQVVENAREWIWDVDINGLYTYASTAVEKILGYKPEEIVGKKHFYDLFHPDDRQQFKKDAFKFFEQKLPFHEFLNKNIHKNGEIVWLLTSGVPLVDEQGELLGYRGADEDITDRKWAEKVLRESEEQYRAIFEQAADSIVLIEAATGRLVRFNDRAHQSLGYTREEFEKLKIPDFEIIESAEEVAGHIKEVIRGGGDTFETKHKTKSGEIRNILVSTRAVSVGGQDFVQGIWRDITDRKRAEEKLLEYQSQLKSLTSELQLTEERERRHLALGLHDNIGQNLALTKLAVQSLMASVSDSKVLSSLDKVCASIDKIIKDTHSLTFELSNPVLYELGFEAAVEQWLSEQIQEKCGLRYKFNVDGKPFQLDNEISIVLFQAVRELLINVVKHAKAETVEVVIRKAEDRIEISVVDDGVGFTASEPEMYSPSNKTGGFGLFSIRERLEYLGGDIKIKSLPGEGSRVMLTAPLK